ncbi:hypothetical protein HDU79_000625 [Rhizoclosmatium sp. JEL0117]|nr:hypothetical protein HDU79_000625 [Rhizoclosmatium sp. JEL0117]
MTGRRSTDSNASIDDDFQTRTIRPVFVREEEDEDETGSQFDVSSRLFPTLVASLPLRYAKKGEFFDEEMCADLEGLLPAFVYAARIKALNQRLSKYATLLDYSPATRTTIFISFIVFSIVFVLLASKITGSAVVLWCASFIGLGGMFSALLLTYRKPSSERYLEAQLESFSHQDEHIQLIWSSVRNHHQPMFTCDWSRRAAQVPWKIIVTHVNKHGAESQFLPAYTPDFVELQGRVPLEVSISVPMDDLPTVERREEVSGLSPQAATVMSRPPSYRSYVPS